MRSAAGDFDNPGMVMMSPHLATTNPAPADPLTSCTVMRKLVGTPSLVASSVSEYCVFAIHTGVLPIPCCSSHAIDFSAAGE